MKQTIEQRLQAGLAKHTREDGDCLIWTGTRHPKTSAPVYGGIGVRRAFWQMQSGRALTKRDRVVGTCNNPRCLAHLERSTFSAVSIRVARDPKSRAARSVASATAQRARSANLDMQKVREIRASTENQHTLGARYGVDHSLISKIQTGRAWAELVASPFAGMGARA
jgi:hypothetical protein